MSHRWGVETDMCKTVKANFQERLQHISIEHLSLGFRDAIQIVRQLGIRFLWIDSICIVQDDDNAQDWARESIRMVDYYQNALFTVVLTDKMQTSGVRIASQEVPRRTLIRLRYLDHGFFYLMEHYCVDDFYQLYILNSELATRAWVFQEGLLSSRMLYFTPDHVLLECRTNGLRNTLGEKSKVSISGLQNIECRTNGLRNTLGEMLKYLISNSSSQNILSTTVEIAEYRGAQVIEGRASDGAPYRFIDLPTIMLNQPNDRFEQSYGAWYRLVAKYSSLHLTFWTDSLMALAGIAIEYQTSQSAESPLYAAGLWTTDFHVGLLWIQFGKPKQSEPKRVEGIPSWSWATVPAQVSWPLLTWWGKIQPTCLFLKIGWVRAEEGPGNEQTRVEAFPMPTERGDGEDPSSHADPTARLAHTNQYTQADSVDARLQFIDRVVDLRLRGKFQKVRFWESASVDDKFLFADRVKAMSGRPELLRYFFAPAKDDIVAGWGVLEGLQLEPSVASDELWALLVMTEVGLPYGNTVGFWGLTCDMYHVLFVQKTGDAGSNRFERMGAGQLFGPEVEEGFRAAEDQEIILI